MYSVQLDKRINQIISLFYRFGLWHRGDEATVRESRLKLFYSCYYFLFPISLVTGAFSSDNPDDFVFLLEVAIGTTVLAVKILYIIWRKEQILELLNRICVYSVEDHEGLTIVNNKLKMLMKFVAIFIPFVWFTGVCCVLVAPFLGSERSLFFNIAFPLDWKNNEIAYWITFVFLVTQVILSLILSLFGVIIWYIMINCSLRYDILGHQIKNMGVLKEVEETANKRKVLDSEKENTFLCDLISVNKRKISNAEKENLFLKDLFSVIVSHKHTNE